MGNDISFLQALSNTTNRIAEAERSLESGLYMGGVGGGNSAVSSYAASVAGLYNGPIGSPSPGVYARFGETAAAYLQLCRPQTFGGVAGFSVRHAQGSGGGTAQPTSSSSTNLNGTGKLDGTSDGSARPEKSAKAEEEAAKQAEQAAKTAEDEAAKKAEFDEAKRRLISPEMKYSEPEAQAIIDKVKAKNKDVSILDSLPSKIIKQQDPKTGVESTIDNPEWAKKFGEWYLQNIGDLDGQTAEELVQDIALEPDKKDMPKRIVKPKVGQKETGKDVYSSKIKDLNTGKMGDGPDYYLEGKAWYYKNSKGEYVQFSKTPKYNKRTGTFSFGNVSYTPKSDYSAQKDAGAFMTELDEAVKNLPPPSDTAAPANGSTTQPATPPAKPITDTLDDAPSSTAAPASTEAAKPKTIKKKKNGLYIDFKYKLEPLGGESTCSAGKATWDGEWFNYPPSKGSAPGTIGETWKPTEGVRIKINGYVHEFRDGKWKKVKAEKEATASNADSATSIVKKKEESASGGGETEPTAGKKEEVSPKEKAQKADVGTAYKIIEGEVMPDVAEWQVHSPKGKHIVKVKKGEMTAEQLEELNNRLLELAKEIKEHQEVDVEFRFVG